MELVADGEMASAKATARIRKIKSEEREVEAELTNVADDLMEGATHIRGWFELPYDPYRLYLSASDEMRRRLNESIFNRLWLVDLDRVDAEVSDPARELVEAQIRWQALRARDDATNRQRPPA